MAVNEVESAQGPSSPTLYYYEPVYANSTFPASTSSDSVYEAQNGLGPFLPLQRLLMRLNSVLCPFPSPHPKSLYHDPQSGLAPSIHFQELVYEA